MLYLDLAINKNDLLTEKERKFPKFIRNFINNFKLITGQVLKYKIDGNLVVVIPKVNRKVLKKLDKIFKTDVTKNICISDNLMSKEEILKLLSEKNINILNGRWLFKYLITDIVDYVCSNMGEISEKQEISILTNDNNLLIFESIKKLSNKVKNINIVTANPKMFNVLVKSICEENGLIVNVTSNYKKACINSNIILNLNFSQEDFNKIVFPKKAVIVNFENTIKMNQKSFNGVNANFYHIDLPKKYKEKFSKLKGFNAVNLYESIVYKRTSAQNIWREIRNDDVKIQCLERKN